MATKVFNLVRQVVLLVITVLGSALLLGATLVECISNYLGLTFAFQLLNIDSRPLDRDPIFGTLIAGLFSHLTFAETSALLMSLAMTVISYYLGHEFGLLSTAINNFRIIANQRADGDKEEWRETAIKTGIKIAFGVLLLGIVFRFSVDLYQFRSAAALLGKADADAIVGMPDWVQLGGMHPGFASRLIGRGGYVNLAVNALLAGLLANMVRRTGLRWERLGETFDTFSGSGNEMASKNPDDPAPPAALATHGSDALLTALPGSLVQPLTPQVMPAALQEAAPATRGSFTLQMPPQKGTDSVASGAEAGDTNREEMFPVWGGSGEVTRAEAEAKPDVYIIDPVNGTIWSRPFYLQLHPEPV